MFEIIKRPIVTEKNTIRVQTHNEYAFEVDMRANRSEIKKAIEKLFGVKVERVNTLVARRQPRRLGRSAGTRKLWKKAMVKLKEGDRIESIAS